MQTSFASFLTWKTNCGENLKVKLAMRDASMAELARALGISRAAVCKWQHTEFPKERLAEIEQFLDDEGDIGSPR